MPSSRIERGYVSAPSGQIHFRQSGVTAERALLLLHQSPSSSAMWEPIMPALAENSGYVLAPDLLGHGSSDPFEGKPSLADYAGGVWAFLDALGVPEVHILGHHSGASIAVHMADERSDRVGSLMLWGVPLMDPVRQQRLSSERAPDWEQAENWLGARWSSRRAASEPGWTPAIGRRAMLELLQAGPESNALHNAIAATPIESLLQRLSQPVITICGERDTLFAESQQSARLVPHGRFVPIPGATLDVADQQPDALVAVIGEWLDRHDGRSAART